MYVTLIFLKLGDAVTRLQPCSFARLILHHNLHFKVKYFHNSLTGMSILCYLSWLFSLFVRSILVLHSIKCLPIHTYCPLNRILIAASDKGLHCKHTGFSIPSRMKIGKVYQALLHVAVDSSNLWGLKSPLDMKGLTGVETL